jgi:ATP-dependent RNA helicase DeaD
LEAAVWFVMRGGERRADVSRLLPLICRLGRVTRKDIGRVVVRDGETRFEISATAADAFAYAVARAGDGGADIRRLDG